MDEPLKSSLDLKPIHPFHALEIQHFHHDEEIIGEGDAPLCFFVLLDGQVCITQRGKRIRILGPRDVFGLEHLTLKRLSPYTARVVKEARIAIYGQEALDHFIREYPRMTYSILNSTLLQLDQTTSNMACNDDPFPIEDVRIIFFSDGDIILEEAKTGKDFYRLISTQKGLSATSGGQFVSLLNTPGEFIGESAVFLNRPYEMTITSMGESVLEVYDAGDLDVIIRDHPEIALRIMNALRLRCTEINGSANKAVT